jgi:hypothetical protein
MTRLTRKVEYRQQIQLLLHDDLQIDREHEALRDAASLSSPQFRSQIQNSADR